MQAPPGTTLVGMDESWKQTLFSSCASIHSHGFMLYSFWYPYLLHKSHRPFPPCSTCCFEKWRNWRNQKCRNSTGVKWQESVKRVQRRSRTRTLYNMSTTAIWQLLTALAWWVVPCWQHVLLTTGHYFFTRFGDHNLMEGKDLEKVHGRREKVSMKSAGGKLIQQKLWIKRNSTGSSHKDGIFLFL